METTEKLGVSIKPTMGKMQTIKARALRYFDAVVAVILIGAVCYLLGLRFGVNMIGAGQTICLYVALAILLTAVLSTCFFRLVLRAKTLRYVAAYPSVSAVSAAVLACAVIYVPILRHYRQSILFATGILLVAVAVREVWILIRGVLSSSKKRPEPEPIGWPNELRWILAEKPVEAVGDDRFGYSTLVHRLASMVEQNSCQSFGLTGPHGSGKTSVLKMVEGVLRKRGNKHWFLFVGGWGKTDENISANVLEAIVQRLHEEGVEALSLLAWPADYMREILGDSSFLLRTMRCCIKSQHNSVAVLQRLDPVLDAIAKRVVVVVEDVDRNTSGDGMDTLCHLLDDFRQTRNVSFFFLKSEETNTGIDFHRLCEHTEMMPHIAPDVLAGLVDQILQAAKGAGSTKLLLHADRLDIKRLVVQRQVGECMLEGNVAWSALSTLAHTPRSLKHALRRTMRIWTELAGEVDLLELLLWSLLREGCPRGYEFIKNNLGELRQLPHDIIVDEKKEAPVRRIWKQIEALGLPSAQDTALKVALTILGFKVSIYKDESFYIGMTAERALMGKGFPLALQSICNDKPTDYFRRLEAGKLDDREMSDQLVLVEIGKYVRDRSGDLPGKVAESKTWAEKVVQFEGALPTGRLVDLIEDHVVALGKMHGGKAHDESPGFMELRRLWKERGDAYEPLRDRVPAIICHSLDYSLELACSIYAWYVDKRNIGLEKLIREKWVGDLRERLDQREGYLEGVLDADCPWALFHTTKYRDEYPAYNTPQDWQWLMPHIIAAVTAHHRGAVSNVAHLFIRDMRGPRGGAGAWFEMESEYFEGMCPTAEDRAALARGLLRYAESRSENDPTAFMIQYVKENLSRYCDAAKSS